MENTVTDCGCKISTDQPIPNGIIYCPKHKSADDMYEALKGMMEIAEMAMPDTFFQSDSRVNAVRQAIARAEGK
ncbi:hypothetical protein LCGC14_2328730 [marine sediment metagenome]|uniref:Uncharacterized protein n=1 Tax=marine sediment metagenome TaxID=412755 RepID=A0A0F9FAH9_9ZZZZ